MKHLITMKEIACAALLMLATLLSTPIFAQENSTTTRETASLAEAEQAVEPAPAKTTTAQKLISILDTIKDQDLYLRANLLYWAGGMMNVGVKKGSIMPLQAGVNLIWKIR